MNVSRRDFLKWAAGSAAALGLSQLDLFKLEKAFAAGLPPIVWLEGSNCGGCSVSTLNAVNPTLEQALTDTLFLRYHALFMATGEECNKIDTLCHTDWPDMILIVEGGIPTTANGGYCIIESGPTGSVTALAAVQNLAPRAKWVLAAGTCAAFGGVVSAYPNQAGVIDVRSAVSLVAPAVNVINVPGCPVPPENLFGTIIQLLLNGSVALDAENRPYDYYGQTVHDLCPRNNNHHLRDTITTLGPGGCYANLGCKGPSTHAGCPRHKWNNGKNFCVEAGHPCIGCAETSFPEMPLVSYR